MLATARDVLECPTAQWCGHHGVVTDEELAAGECVVQHVHSRRVGRATARNCGLVDRRLEGPLESCVVVVLTVLTAKVPRTSVGSGTRYLSVSLDTIVCMAMTLRLSKDQTSRLRDAAIRENMSMQAIALRAVDDYLDKRDARRRELLAQILREDAGLLRRLADA